MHKQTPKRIVLTTFGSLGDLHPYIALALELRARGHEAVLATSPIYREKIEGAGLGFCPVRPDLPEPEESQEMIAKVMDERQGPGILFNEILMPSLKESYDDLLVATEGADLMVTHRITFAAPLVAEKLAKRWVSLALQPSIYLSSYDPPALSGVPRLFSKYRPSPWLARLIMGIAKKVLAGWLRPVQRVRREIGLPPASAWDMQTSPYLDLALFSRTLGAPQPDWPKATRQCGFVFYDRLTDKESVSAEVAAFLDAGPPPVTFTLGSSAVMSPGSFYQVSIEAAKKLNARALLLVGTDPGGILSQKLPEGILAAPYAPYSEVFPRSAVIVHQGGAGTTAQALRAGRPQLIVPFAYDQPDNGARVARLCAGRVLPRRRYTAESAARELREILSSPAYAEGAAKVGKIVQEEKGVEMACDEIEQQLGIGRVV